MTKILKTGYPRKVGQPWYAATWAPDPLKRGWGSFDRFRAVQGAYHILPIKDEGKETLITLKRNTEIGNKYTADLGISFDKPMNTRNLAIMLHGGELMGDEVAVKDSSDGDKEKIIVNAKIGYDGNVANEIGAELTKWFREDLNDNDHEIMELNKRIKKAEEEMK